MFSDSRKRSAVRLLLPRAPRATASDSNSRQVQAHDEPLRYNASGSIRHRDTAKGFNWRSCERTTGEEPLCSPEAAGGSRVWRLPVADAHATGAESACR